MDKEQSAIWRLQKAAQIAPIATHKPLTITYSGGKDSQVLLELAKRAGIDYQVVHHHTTADAPETVRFIRQQFQKLDETGIKTEIAMPYYKGKRTSMWDLIVKKMFPPTRLARYCCEVLKENSQATAGCHIVTGVRWAESTKRKNTRAALEVGTNNKHRQRFAMDNTDDKESFDGCGLAGHIVYNPIIEWSDREVWDYLRDCHSVLNPLYSEGFCRVGCIGCPMAGTQGRLREFARWPMYETMYKNTFKRMQKARIVAGKQPFYSTDLEQLWFWWLQLDILPGQLTFDDF